MEKEYLIYKAMFPNGKFYIGMTGNLKQRIQDHKKKINRDGKTKFYCAARKYGFENIIWITLSNHSTFEEMCLAECEAIKSLKPEYNITDGGIAPKMQEETKEKIRKFHSCKIKTEEQHANMKEARKKVLEEKGKKLKDKSGGEIFIDRFNRGILNEKVVNNLKKLKEIDDGNKTLNQLAEEIDVNQCTIVKYQRHWIKIDEYKQREKTRPKYEKSYDKDKKWGQKAYGRKKKRENLYRLSKLNTENLSIREVAKLTGFSNETLHALKRSWENIIEEEGF